MRVTRVVAGSTAAITAALGLSLATASPAAADAGTWVAYGNTNPITSSKSTWKCNTTAMIITDVVAQVCVVRSVAGTDIQGAVIVRNNRSTAYSLDAQMNLSIAGNHLGSWACSSSGVAANSWKVCFGTTFPESRKVNNEAWAGNKYLGVVWDA